MYNANPEALVGFITTMLSLVIGALRLDPQVYRWGAGVRDHDWWLPFR